jgi:hypothetical protein
LKRIQQDQDLAARFASEAVAAEAEVIDMGRPNDGRVRLTYRYTAGGGEFTSRASIQQRAARQLHLGSLVLVRYLRSEPGKSWFGNSRPSAAPVWFVFLIPPMLVLAAGTLVFVLRRQARLLAEGRAALATVTNTDKRKGRQSTTSRVRYEWRLLSGAMRSRSFDSQDKAPPAAGTAIPIVYDRDNPQHHARYPLSLVRIPGSQWGRRPRPRRPTGSAKGGPRFAPFRHAASGRGGAASIG